MKGERGPAGAPGSPGQRGNDGRDGELGLPGQKGAEVRWTFLAIFPLSVNTLTYKRATCFTKSTSLFRSLSGFIASITEVNLDQKSSVLPIEKLLSQKYCCLFWYS